MSNTKLIAYFSSLPEVKRIKALEPYINNNPDIQKAFFELKEAQRKMVISKEMKDMTSYSIYTKEYNLKKEKLLDMPFVEEYLELVDIVNTMIRNLSDSIEAELYKKINE